MFSCDYCQKQFNCKQNYNYHMNHKSCLKRVCSKCNKKFTTSTSYNYHILHEVCLKKLGKGSQNEPTGHIAFDLNIESIKQLDNEKLKLYLDFKLKMKRLENEKDRIDLEKSKIKNKTLIKLKANKQNIQNTTNNTININNVNLITFGNENLEPLQKDVLCHIYREPEHGFTNYGIRELYFNRDYPENQIVKAKYPHSNKAEYFNGEYWCVSKKKDIAEKLLNGLVDGVKKRFKELPLDDKELDQMYDKIADYISDEIDDASIFPRLVNLVSEHIVNHSRGLT